MRGTLPDCSYSGGMQLQDQTVFNFTAGEGTARSDSKA